MKISFTKCDVKAMHAELEAKHKRLLKLILVKEIAVSHRSDEINRLRLREKLTTWRSSGFDRIEVQDERQQRSQGHICSGDDPKHCQTIVYFYPRRPPIPHELPRVCGQR